jgi:hypothetical protein
VPVSAALVHREREAPAEERGGEEADGRVRVDEDHRRTYRRSRALVAYIPFRRGCTARFVGRILRAVASKITTPEGFRDAVDEFGARLVNLSPDQAAAMADSLKGAAPKASQRFAADDLDDVRIELETLKNRLRRQWKRQRSANAYSTVMGAAIATITPWIGKIEKHVIPPWVIVALVAAGVLFALMGLRAISEASDWRDDVLEPLDEVAGILAKELGSRKDDDDPYRRPALESTRTRVDLTVETADGAVIEVPSAPGEDEGKKKR